MTVKQRRSFLRNNSPGMSKLKSTCPETVLKKVPEWEFNLYSFTGIFREKLELDTQTTGLRERHSTCPAEHFKEHFYEETKISGTERKNTSFWWIYFGRNAKTVFDLSRETLWEKWIFLAKLENFEILLPSSRTCESWQKFSPEIQTDF